jgi:hypothetical protein
VFSLPGRIIPTAGGKTAYMECHFGALNEHFYNRIREHTRYTQFWPPYSPDLNTCSYFMGYSERKFVQKHSPPSAPPPQHI